MTAVERLLATAKGEIGYLEKETNSQLDNKTANAGDNNWNKYARDLDSLGTVYNGKKNGYSWCDIFVDWCFIYTFGLKTAMEMLNQDYNGPGAGCTYSAQYFKNAGRFFPTPRVGDQIFFSKDGGATSYHTGIVTKVSGRRVYTIEGNTSSLAGVVENGGCVRDKSYPLGASYIAGYGRPDYSLVTEEEEEDMDQSKFNELFKQAMAEYRKSLQDNDKGEWSKEAREWAISIGLFAGNGTTDDGEPNMMWEDMLTREQVAQLFYRFSQKHGLA